MNRIIFSALTILISLTLKAQWTDSGNNLTTSDNVGIGLTSPVEKLHIKSGVVQFSNLGDQDNVDIIKIAENGTTYNQFTLTGLFNGSGESGNALKWRSTWNDNLFVLRGDGHIGLGSPDPVEKLHITSGALQFSNLGDQDNVDIIKIAENGTTYNQFTLTGLFSGSGESGNALKWRSTWNDNLFMIRGDGKIGIGTTDFSGNHKLRVEGSIGAREIKVEASGWSDFVFESDYKLRTLEEVEEHITDKGHLPEIPNEQEITENGINLGEMNAKLLMKIEELTLYLIEQNKQNLEQQKLIEQLQNEVSALKNK